MSARPDHGRDRYPRAAAVGLPSRRAARILVLVSVLAWLSANEAAKPKDTVDPLSFDQRIMPLLGNFCYPCHNERKTKGDVNLRRDADLRMIADDRKVWITALKEVGEGKMPPEKAKQPSDDERKLLLAFIERTVNTLDCTQQKDPGRPSVRRLNRNEYDNTIRALFDLDLTLGQQFSPDGSSYGFDTIAEALSIAPVQVEQYYQAADRALDAAFKDRKALASFLIRQPGPGLDGRSAAREVIAAFAARAYRKPVASDTVDRLLVIYDLAVAARKSYGQSVRAMMQAVLLSPRFLVRIEESDDKATAPYPVAPYDLAARLSYFLWSSPPDEELLRLAAEKRLQDPSTLEQQARRMLADPRSRALAENFAGQWLQLRQLSDHRPDATRFPEFTPSLRQAMLDEAYLFIGDLVHNDRPITDLLDANYTFLNEELARHYGISGVKGSRMQRVALTDGRRGGVVTMAAVLTITADPTRTNIPRRGNYVMGTLLGEPPPPPPANVPPLDMSAKDGPPKTLREMLEMHRRNPECASCHAKTDPLGFGLENYDAIGRWQETQNGKPIDASGTLPSGEKFNGPVEMKRILSDRRLAFARGMSESLLIYALGRGLQRSDECVVRDALQALEHGNFKLSALVTTIVRSYPFTYRRNADY